LDRHKESFPESDLGRFFDLSQDLLCIAGTDGDFKRLNPAWQRTLGYTVEELLAKPWLHFIHPDDHDSAMQAVNKQRAGESILTFENRFRHKDGSYRWFSWTASSVQDQGLIYATARDITERKQMEMNQHRLAAIVESSDDSILGMTLDGIVTSWNKGAERLFGYAADEIEGQPVAILLPPDRPDEETRIIARLRQGEQIGHFETVRRRKDGRLIDVSLTISPIKDEQGTIVGVSKIAHDITARRRAEEELTKSHEQTEAANKELEAFSYSVAHDLRAPLRHIDGFSELLGKHAATLDEKGRRYLKMIAESAKQMGTLIDDLLNFSRIGRAGLRPSTVSLDQLVKETLASLTQEMDGRKIAWTIGALPDVQGDPALLRQAFVNLLSNAVKYTRGREEAKIEIGALPPTEAGGKQATGNRQEAQGKGQEVGGNGQEDEVVIFVRDNGAGFDMQYAHKLFGIFQRLHAAHEFEGTGIGLANVRQIVARHGGRVWAEGKVGEGATFYIALPKKQAVGDGH